MSDQKSAEDLLKIYNEIDAFLRHQLHSDRHTDHSHLIQEVARTNHTVARYEAELRAMAQLRNVIVHNPIEAVASPIAYPHPETIKRYKAIHTALLRPRTALSIAILASKIYTATPKTLLNKLLQDMSDSTFTHVPIIEDNQMVGIFSENTLLSYLADNPETIILGDMAIDDFKSYIPLKAHKGEDFTFLPRNALLADVYEIFNQAIKVRRRIGMIFITEHGQPTEKPLGIITAWDLASPEFDLRQ